MRRSHERRTNLNTEHLLKHRFEKKKKKLVLCITHEIEKKICKAYFCSLSLKEESKVYESPCCLMMIGDVQK
jgi:hypothetical protein